jgi:DNA-binding IclR family transcriptional regulator
LEELAGNEGPLGPTDLSRRLELPKSSVANICGALVAGGLTRKVDGGYVLGQKLAELGASYLASVDEVREFQAVCREWSPQYEDTVQLAVLSQDLDVTYLARHDGSHPVRLVSDIGRSLPANCTATGKSLLAGLSDEELERRLPPDGKLPVLTPNSIPTTEKLLVELETVRERGYAVDDEETLEGLSCVAMAVPGSGRQNRRWAVSFTLLKGRLNEQRILLLVKDLQGLTSELERRLTTGKSLQ